MSQAEKKKNVAQVFRQHAEGLDYKNLLKYILTSFKIQFSKIGLKLHYINQSTT